MRSDKVYVVVPYFNPLQFESRKRLFLQFKKEMEAAGVQLLVVEAALDDIPFQVTDPCDDWAVQIRTNSFLWHKERLINIGITKLFHNSPDAWYIGWFDGDISFTDPDWPYLAMHALRNFEVIQPFAQAIFLDRHEEELWNCKSTFCYFLDARGYHQVPPLQWQYLMAGHPGLAWMATARALKALGGVYDKCAAGSGDTVMANALKGAWDVFLPVHPTGNWARSMQDWAGRCESHIQGKIGFARGALLHHWHGPAEKRGYEKRWSILSFHDFDPDKDLVLEPNGLYRWAGNKPGLEQDVRRSLSERNEDE